MLWEDHLRNKLRNFLVMLKTNKKLLIAVIIVSLLLGGTAGYITGYSYGFGSGVSWSVDVGLKFLQTKGIDIDVDKNMLKNGIMQYKNNIGGCLFAGENNASLYNN